MSKLLIIDDEDDFREILAKRFRFRGYEVISLSSGKDIKNIIRQNEDIDVIILDLKMPDISGEEVLKIIKNIKKEVQVIILTGHGSTESAVEMTRMDAFTYLQKPVPLDRLIEIVEQAKTKVRLLMAEKAPAEPRKTYKKEIICASAAVLVGLFIAFLPTPEGLPKNGHNFLAFLATIIILWVSEAVPIGITALLTGGGLILFGIQGPKAAWAPYASPAVMFVMMIIMFGVVLNEVGIAKRIINFVIKIAGTNVVKFSLIVSLVCSFSSSVFHDATITIIFIFAIIPIFTKMGITPKNSTNLSKFLTILIPLAASAGGFGTVLGGGRNPIALELLKRETGIHIGFLDWIVYQLPMVGLASLGVWAVCYIFMNPRTKELPDQIKAETLPPMSRNEKMVSAIFLLAFLFWTLSDFTGLHLSVIASLALVAICSLNLVSFKKIIDNFAWEAWLVFGAGVSLGVAMLDTGAGKWIADQFMPLLTGKSSFIQYYGIGLFGAVISSIMSNSAAVALCLPILFPMAEGLHLSASNVALMMPVSTSFVMLIIGCPPTIIAYSAGYFKQTDFMRVAIPLVILVVMLLTVVKLIYWPLIGFA
jgi:sodium-dependent dicarboxylate transporter 2/3/5